MKVIGFDQRVYILLFDRRGSFQTKMFGWHGDLTATDRRDRGSETRERFGIELVREKISNKQVREMSLVSSLAANSCAMQAR